jgi:hypothetical protein
MGDIRFNSDVSAAYYLRNAAAGFDLPLFELPNRFPTRNMAGVKGAFVLSMLADEVGVQRFRDILATIAERFAYRNLSFDELWTEIERGADTQLGWFRQQWIERAGAPDWEVSWRQEGHRVAGTVIQREPFYRAKLELIAEGVDTARATAVLSVDGPSTPFAIDAPFPVRALTLDPDYRVLRWTTDMRDLAESFRLVTRAQAQPNVEAYRTALAQLPSPDRHGVAFLAHTALMRLLIQGKQLDEAWDQGLAAVESPTRDPYVLPSVYLELARMAQGRGDTNRLRWAAEAAIAADAATASRSVTDAALAMLAGAKQH